MADLSNLPPLARSRLGLDFHNPNNGMDNLSNVSNLFLRGLYMRAGMHADRLVRLDRLDRLDRRRKMKEDQMLIYGQPRIEIDGTSGKAGPGTERHRSLVPSLVDQAAWMDGSSQWQAPASRPVCVDYAEGYAWFVVRTNPRCEGRAMATLGEKGFATFLPKGRKELIHHRTKKVIEREFPLLVGYVFLAMPVSPRLRHWGVVRECHGVQSVLGSTGGPVAVPRAEVDALRSASDAGLITLGSARHSFQVGEQARIASGPFSGFVGQVDAATLKVVRVLITLFGRLTEVLMPVDELEPV